MASPQPYWVEKELRTYNSAYRVWFQLGIDDHVTIAEMFTSETSAYQGLLVILEQAVSLLSFRDLLVRLHLMICFFPFSIKTDNSVKKREKNSIGSYKSRTCDWKRTDLCKGVWERWMNVYLSLRLCLRLLLLSMRIDDLLWKREFCFHRDLCKTSYAVWNGRTVKDILNLVSKDIKIFPKW